MVIVSIALPTNAMAQTADFDKTVRNLFFGADIMMTSAFDSLMKLPDLHHSDEVLCQSSLSTTIKLKADKDALACRHFFVFTRSPVPNMRIDTGYIEITMGQAPGIRKILDVNWELQFDTKEEGMACFGKLKSMFTAVSTTKKFEFDKSDKVYIAEFSTRNPAEKGIRDITLMFGRFAHEKKYRMRLIPINEFSKKQ